jgi:3-oxoacyl-[acyl-carrier-protein] synthase-3
MTRFAQIASTGRYVPERVVTNAELEATLGEPVADWLVKNVGIRERHFMAEGEEPSDMAVAAAKQAIERAGIAAADVDLLIVATDTPDSLSPATAALVQHRLGARRAGVFDLNTACASWVTAVDVGSKAIMADDQYRNVVVAATYGMSRFIDWKDKKTCTLFADGAGAVVLKSADRPGILRTKLAAFGELHDALGVFGGGAKAPDQRPYVRFARRLPPTFNTEQWTSLVREVAQDTPLHEIAFFVFTQLNFRTIEATMAALGQAMAKTHTTMDKWGYTGSACIPLTLDDAYLKGKLHPGDQVILCASGGGLAMACTLLRWTRS